AGHGGTDPGAIASTGVFEKDIVFGFAQALAARLETGGRYRVRMTRDRDVFVPLAERVRIAREAKADLFI
ncbi:N-acetylmuramoyl-L-alanine amidase family protein, partial [Escherichia coli]